MQYCAAGSVSDLMEIGGVCLTEEQAKYTLAGTLLGLQYLHAKKLIHRDLKGGNILLTEDGGVRLADFGVSAALASTASRRGTVIGTPFWMSPECIQETGYDARADIWSLGIVAIELVEGEPPLSNLHPMRAIFAIPNRDPPTLKDPSAWSVEFSDFIATCLVKDLESRPAAAKVMEHPWIASAVADLEANDGVSPVLQNMVAKHMPAIVAARREELEVMEMEDQTYGKEDAAVKEMTSAGTLRAGDAGARTLVYKTGTIIQNGSLVKHKGTVALHSAGAAEPSTPSFMQHFKAQQAAAPAPAPAAAAAGTAQQPADVLQVGGVDFSALSEEELRARLREVDAAFRKRVAELSKQYDQAKTAINAALKAK